MALRAVLSRLGVAATANFVVGVDQADQRKYAPKPSFPRRRESRGFHCAEVVGEKGNAKRFHASKFAVTGFGDFVWGRGYAGCLPLLRLLLHFIYPSLYFQDDGI